MTTRQLFNRGLVIIDVSCLCMFCQALGLSPMWPQLIRAGQAYALGLRCLAGLYAFIPLHQAAGVSRTAWKALNGIVKGRA